jgi:predicted double-glycine peptidase
MPQTGIARSGNNDTAPFRAPAVFVSQRLALACASIGVLVATGCATVEPFRGLPIGKPVMLITSVPPYCQDRQFSCGAACVISVAEYWEVNTSIAVTNQKTLRTDEDLTAEDLKQLAERLGLQCFVYQGSWDDMHKNIGHGRPIIVLIPKPSYYAGPNLAINNVPITTIAKWFTSRTPHWVIVIGQAKQTVILQDPAFGRREIPRGTFEGWWKQKRNTTVLLAPKQ